jgi:hypothetical protein
VSDLRFLPAATLVRAEPGTALAASPAGSTVHVLNRPGGAPLCGRTPRKLTALPVDQPAPPLRVCGFCIPLIPAKVRVGLAPTDAEATAVHEHADRRRPDRTPLFGDGPGP